MTGEETTADYGRFELLNRLEELSKADNRSRDQGVTALSPDEPLLLRAEEAAKLLGIGRTKVFEMANRGRLPVIRIGHALRIPRKALVDWIAENTEAPYRRDEEPLPGWLHGEASRARAMRR